MQRFGSGPGSNWIPAPDPLRFLFPDPDPLKKALIWIRVAPKQTNSSYSITLLCKIVDGLDSVEQRKILTVLDTVHSLFSDPGLPFIIVLAIDPHVIIKVTQNTLIIRKNMRKKKLLKYDDLWNFFIIL